MAVEDLFLTLTTELEAVNAMLASIGESPVAEIDDTFVDALTAQSLLKAESRRVQLHGWSFNEEFDLAFSPDTAGEIHLPQNTLKFLSADKTVTQRGFRLYNKTTRNFTFTADVTASELVTALAFEALPEALRSFLALMAGRKFQDRMQSDQILHAIQERDAQIAWIAFKDYEAEQYAGNVIESSRTVQRIKANR
jgi:hypothetical protein